MPLLSLRGTIVLLVVFILASAGCQTSRRGDRHADSARPVSRQLEPARKLYASGRHEEALLELVDIAHIHPHAEGLDELRILVMTALTEQREQTLHRDAELTRRRMQLDVERNKAIPDTYGMRRYLTGETESLRTAGAPAQEVLMRPVTLYLDSVDLNEFILAVGASEGINIVADSMDTERRMTIHAENVPFREILNYVERNLDVAFYAGENLIWATPRPPDEPATPMETRLYRLRKGLSGEEIESESLNIEKAIQRFVSAPEGFSADDWWLFDRKAHVLIARNTRENLARVEDLIEHLDVCPPQVSIEAHFISAEVSDMQELGIDWLMKSPLITSRKTITEDGRRVSVPRTQIDSGARFPFTPQGDGLSFTYQGLLTEPMFDAVLHALHLSGKARTLSAPKVTTVNNREARIRVGEDFRYFDTYKIENILASITDGGDHIYTTRWVPDGSPKLEELGYELVVTPSVGADLESITLRLTPEISEFVRYERFPVIDDRSGRTSNNNNLPPDDAPDVFELRLPIFRRNIIETEVIARSGETVVMGGLITQSDQAEEKKIPILSALPLLGKLFRSDGVRESKQNLLIFVTAKLITQRGEDLLPIRDPRLTPEESLRREFFPVSVTTNAVAPPEPPPPLIPTPPPPPPPQFHQPPEGIDVE